MAAQRRVQRSAHAETKHRGPAAQQAHLLEAVQDGHERHVGHHDLHALALAAGGQEGGGAAGGSSEPRWAGRLRAAGRRTVPFHPRPNQPLRPHYTLQHPV